ncbi:MAG: enolase C-terminal domain-like protein [Motilibacteraceae bacterium]
MTRRLPVDRLEVAACTVPTDAPEADGTITWDSTTLVVVHAHAGGVAGLGWTYAGPACVPVVSGELADVVAGRDALDVPGTWEAMARAVRNLGRPGLVSCALSAVDQALWDLKARLLDVPLAQLFGRVHDAVEVYGSGGFTTYDDERTRQQVGRWAHDLHIPRVKIKIGESWGTQVQRDVHRVELVRDVVGAGCEVFVDANGGYTVGQAVRVGRRLDDLGVTWFEEPVSSDDLAGLAEVRHALDADVAAGEYGYDLHYVHRMVEADAVDCLQVDVTRCGGYGEWLRAAAVAAAHGLQVSAHCAPNAAVHVAAATPNVRHLEYFHDHARIEDLLFDGALSPAGGSMTPDVGAPGNGLTFKAADAEQYRVA